MKISMKFIVAISLTVIVLASCGKKTDENSGGNGVSNFSLDKSGITYTLNGTPVLLAGITFVPASEWTDFGAAGMRKASYAFSAIVGETDSATVKVFYFGTGGGGAISDNINRWVGQMEMVEGSNPDSFVQQSEISADGMIIHLIKVNGIFKSGGMMSGPTVKKENYTLVGAVLEAPEGNIFFKLTGPSKTANAMAEAMVAMLEAITKN